GGCTSGMLGGAGGVLSISLSAASGSSMKGSVGGKAGGLDIGSPPVLSGANRRDLGKIRGLLPLLFVVLARGGSLEYVNTANLPWAVVDRVYQTEFAVQSAGMCPAGGLGYQLMSGELPPGLHLSAAGVLSGTPAKTGEFAFGIRAMNGCAWTQ